MDEQLKRLLHYCTEQKLVISPSICPQHDKVSGLGLQIASPVKKGERLIFAPTTALLTTAVIPSDFLPSKHVRQELSIHGLLAAWLAFGDSVTLEDRYGPWMKVWPSWSSFRDSMPVFWQSQLLRESGTVAGYDSSSATKRRRLSTKTPGPVHDRSSDKVSKNFSFSPVIDGWLTPFSSPHQKPLTEQVCKLRNILTTLRECRDVLGFDIVSDDAHTQYTNLLHMWCCVNSRCFYYVPHGTKAPQDPNEAMALVPFLDLFNHATIGKGAEVKFDKKGFTVIADRDYSKGEEIFIQYGSHTNDALWIEYGFLLDHNEHDEATLDQIILAGLSDEVRRALEDADYLGNYTFSASAIGYRMETAAWLVCGSLSPHKWQQMIQGTYDPEKETAAKYGKLRLSMKKQLVDWLLEAKQSCEKHLAMFSPMRDDAARHWKPSVPDTDLVQDKHGVDEDTSTQIASVRRDMCLTRWEQLHNMCKAALQVLSDEHPQLVTNKT